MSRYRDLWEGWCERFMLRPRRERMIVALACVLGPALITSTVLVEPETAKRNALARNIESGSQESQKFAAQWAGLQERIKLDPDAAVKAEITALRAKLEAIDSKLLKTNQAMIRPEQMTPLLERLLARQPGLQLAGLRTLAPTSFIERKEAVAADKNAARPNEVRPAFDIFRHGVELRLTGSFADLQAYLGQLEKEKQQMMWGELRLKVVDYPKAEMTLTIYTLSTERQWLAI